MEIREAMTRKLITIRPDASILKAAKEMLKHKISGLIVTNNGFQIKGIITKSDIVRAFATGKKPTVKVSEIMKSRVISIEAHKTLEEAAAVMVKHNIKRLPVVSKGQCIGIITVSDLIRYEDRLIDKLSVLFLLPQKTTQAV